MLLGEVCISYIEWINMQKLAILGFKKEYVYFALFMLGILIVYVLLQPVIQWLLHKNSYKLLTYVISSLLTLVIVLFIAYKKGEGKEVDFTVLIKNALLTLTMFGMGLLIKNSLYYLLQKWYKQSV